MTDPRRAFIHQVMLALREHLALKGVGPTKYPHLKRYAQQLVRDLIADHELRRV